MALVAFDLFLGLSSSLCCSRWRVSVFNSTTATDRNRDDRAKTSTSHADAQTLLISTALAVSPSGDRYVTTSDILAFKLVAIASIAQEERLQTRQHTAIRLLSLAHSYVSYLAQ